MPRYVNARFTRSEIIQRIYNLAGLARGKYEKVDVVFGVESAVHPRSGKTTGEILAINEFGRPDKNIPARPFMRTSTEIIKNEVRTYVRRLRGRKLPWVGPKEAEHIGVMGRGIIQETIVQWSEPPNAPKTIAIKGFDDPLVETNLLWRSVEFDIRRSRN